MQRAALICTLLAALALPARAITLSEGVDTTGLTWTTGGQAGWSGENYLSHDEDDAIESGAITDDAESWVQTTITGPGILTFWWKVSSEPEVDKLEFYLGPTLQGSIAGEVDWTKRIVVLPAGNFTVRWRYVRDLFGGGLLDAAWLDEVSFVPAIDLAESLDVPWAGINSGGNIGWVGQTNVTHDSEDAAQSGPITDNQVSWFETTVKGPLTFSFWWKVSSEQGFDVLEFYVGGPLKKQISGEVDWTEETVSVPAGTQTLRWQYRKDQRDSAGQDKAWVDLVGLPKPFWISSATLQPDHSFLLTITGLKSGTNYQLQTSSNLAQWWPFLQITGTVSDAYIVDSSAGQARLRFYRVSSP
jgi:hypothetical protein